MTEWGIDTLFNPGKRHMDEEKRRLQSTREEVGDASGGRRVDFGTGTVRISRPAAGEQAEDERTEGETADDETPADERAEDEAAGEDTPQARAVRRRLAAKPASSDPANG